jgi:hypothetical protein
LKGAGELCERICWYGSGGSGANRRDGGAGGGKARGDDQLLGAIAFTLSEDVASTNKANSEGDVNSSTASLCRRKFDASVLSVETRRGMPSALVGAAGLCIAAGADDPDQPRPDSLVDSYTSGGG